MGRKQSRPEPQSERKAGAKLKLTPELQARVVELLELGTGRMRAARGAGIAPQTFFAWLREGEAAASGLKRSFSDAVHAAEDRYHEELAAEVKRIALHGEADGVRLAAAKFALERRYADDWGARQEVRHQGPNGGAVQVESKVAVTAQPLISDEALGSMTDEQLAATIGALLGG